MIEQTPQPDITLVIPLYNEEAVLPLLVHRLEALLGRLDDSAEVVIVDDGSTDTTSIFVRALAQKDPRFTFIRLSRNFGHQAAITAGMEAARGNAIIVMDGDLQDPPEVVEEMISRWREGYDIVHGRRLSRESESAFKRATAKYFYRGLNALSSVPLPLDVGDFRLMDRKVLDAFLAMPERDRYVRGMVAWLGFNQTFVEFHRPARAAGETHYPVWKMLKLATTGLVGFSDAPLRLAIWTGMAVSLCAVAYGLYAVGLKLFGGHVIEGWTSTMVVISFLCGANMLISGIIGLYIGGIHREVKQRPLYIVGERINGFSFAPRTRMTDGASTGEPERKAG